SSLSLSSLTTPLTPTSTLFPYTTLFRSPEYPADPRHWALQYRQISALLYQRVEDLLKSEQSPVLLLHRQVRPLHQLHLAQIQYRRLLGLDAGRQAQTLGLHPHLQPRPQPARWNHLGQNAAQNQRSSW